MQLLPAGRAAAQRLGVTAAAALLRQLQGNGPPLQQRTEERSPQREPRRPVVIGEGTGLQRSASEKRVAAAGQPGRDTGRLWQGCHGLPKSLLLLQHQRIGSFVARLCFIRLCPEAVPQL